MKFIKFINSIISMPKIAFAKTKYKTIFIIEIKKGKIEVGRIIIKNENFDERKLSKTPVN